MNTGDAGILAALATLCAITIIITFAAAMDITVAAPVITVEMTITPAGRALALASEVEAGKVDKEGKLPAWFSLSDLYKGNCGTAATSLDLSVVIVIQQNFHNTAFDSV